LTITPDPPVTDTHSNGHRPASTAPPDDQVLSALFAALPQPICVHDHGRRLLLANTAAAALVGYRIDELPCMDFECLLLPSDTPRWRRYLREVHNTGTAHASYFRLHHQGGTWLWAHATATAFTAGNVRLVAILWEDRTGEIWEDPRTICTEL
jgi:PAS domain S-box-containing protein